MSKKETNKLSRNQKINCDVSNCNYNNTKDSSCSLKQIKVSSNCNSEDTTNKKETICDSFDCENNSCNECD